jgi:hypothetical protein
MKGKILDDESTTTENKYKFNRSFVWKPNY